MVGDELPTIVRGRCLAYDGGPYRPMAEYLKADAGILDSDPPATILDKARTLTSAGGSWPTSASGTSAVLMSAIGMDVESDRSRVSSPRSRAAPSRPRGDGTSSRCVRRGR